MAELVKKCPECGGLNLSWNRDRGEIICRDCGLVIEEKMVDFSQEWREFDSEEGEKRRRSGAPMTYTQYDQGLGTEVGQKADLLKLGGKDRNKFFRLRKWQYRISTAIERNLKLALAELKRVSSYLKLPKSVEEESARIYTLAVQRGLVRGRSMESVVAGALYAACRRHDVPRTLDELSEASGIEKKEVGRTYRFITRELGITILPSNPADYIARFASALKLSAETQSKSIEILESAQKAELTSGRGQTGIAAAALYVSALIHGEKRTQREVADVAGVTEVTIRNRYKELLDELDLEDEINKKKNQKRMELYGELEKRIGRTPLVKFLGEVPNENAIYIKRECDNPFGSHYDRVYLELFRHHEDSGNIQPGNKVLETTTGAAGVSFAGIGKKLGYDCYVALPAGGEKAREDAIKQQLPSEDHLILTPAEHYVSGFPNFLKRFLVRNKDYFFLNHSMGPMDKHTGRYTNNEITLMALEVIADEVMREKIEIAYFVPTVGNGSSVLGPARAFKKID